MRFLTAIMTTLLMMNFSSCASIDQRHRRPKPRLPWPPHHKASTVAEPAHLIKRDTCDLSVMHKIWARNETEEAYIVLAYEGGKPIAEYRSNITQDGSVQVIEGRDLKLPYDLSYGAVFDPEIEAADDGMVGEGFRCCEVCYNGRKYAGVPEIGKVDVGREVRDDDGADDDECSATYQCVVKFECESDLV